MNLDRLSSFLWHAGGLETKKIVTIKRNVLQLETVNEKKIILKAHKHKGNLLQQWYFFQQLNTSIVVPFIHYPNGSKWIQDREDYLWTISPFIEGRSLHYAYDNDRNAVVMALKLFHQQASQLHTDQIVKKEVMFRKWYYRLLQFKQTEVLFTEFGYQSLYRDIVHITVTYLKTINTIPWHILHRRAREKGTWIHGDVAAHNFIQNEQLHMIDFDLLACAPQLYDYIQLGQRFLPYLDWEMDRLLAYEMVDETELPIWLLAICIPSDVMREILYLLPKNKTSKLPAFFEKLEDDWIKRKSFIRTVELMVKSIRRKKNIIQ